MFELGFDWHLDFHPFCFHPFSCHTDHLYRGTGIAQTSALGGHPYSTQLRLGSRLLDLDHYSPDPFVAQLFEILSPCSCWLDWLAEHYSAVLPPLLVHCLSPRRSVSAGLSVPAQSILVPEAMKLVSPQHTT